MTQTVLITGGSRGIGYATAELFAARGWNVGLCSRSAAQAEDAARRITASTKNENVLGIGADIGKREDIDRLFAAMDGKFKTLDALVNNAAVIHLGNALELSDADFLDMMNINVTGMMRCSKHAFTRMKKGGAIVNISSIAGIQGTDKFPNFWGYTASKFAVVGLTEGLAVEGRPLGIRVNCVAPGATETEMLRKAAPGLKASAQPEDIARIVYYLCDGKESGIVSGTTIPVFSNA